MRIFFDRNKEKDENEEEIIKKLNFAREEKAKNSIRLKEAEQHKAQGKIIIISDSHITQMFPENAKTLYKFLQQVKAMNDVTDIIFLGDIFDFQRGLSSIEHEIGWMTVFHEIIDMIKERKFNIYYIFGNHDMNMAPIFTKAGIGIGITTKESITMQSGNKTFFFIHGHQFEKYNPNFYRAVETMATQTGYSLGAAQHYAWEVYKKAKGRKAEERFDFLENIAKENNIYIVHGHTEVPYISNHVICPGSWDDHMIGKRTFMIIENGKFSIKEWNDGNISDFSSELKEQSQYKEHNKQLEQARKDIQEEHYKESEQARKEIQEKHTQELEKAREEIQKDVDAGKI